MEELNLLLGKDITHHELAVYNYILATATIPHLESQLFESDDVHSIKLELLSDHILLIIYEKSLDQYEIDLYKREESETVKKGIHPFLTVDVMKSYV